MSSDVDAGTTSEDSTARIQIASTLEPAASYDKSSIKDGSGPKSYSSMHNIVDECTTGSLSAEEHLFEKFKSSPLDTLSRRTKKVEDGTTSAINGYHVPSKHPTAGRVSTVGPLGFLDIPPELRDIIYGFFFPRAQVIHLTESVSTKALQGPKAKSYRWSKDATDLMLSCQQVHEETAAFVYRTNSFVFTPWALNYHHSKFALHSNTSLWLSGMRSSTKALVKKLDVYVPKPFLPQSIKALADGLAHFPEVKITIMPLSKVPVSQQANHRRKFEALCLAVQAARVHAQPISWNDGEDVAVADMLADLKLR